MDGRLIKKVKRQLSAQQKRVEKELTKSKKFPEYGNSEEDNTQDVEEYGENIGLEKKLRTLLKDINKALNKLAKGTYGVCEICKSPIEQGRLKIYPAASVCSECASKKK